MRQRTPRKSVAVGLAKGADRWADLLDGILPLERCGGAVQWRLSGRLGVLTTTGRIGKSSGGSWHTSTTPVTGRVEQGTERESPCTFTRRARLRRARGRGRTRPTSSTRIKRSRYDPGGLLKRAATEKVDAGTPSPSTLIHDPDLGGIWNGAPTVPAGRQRRPDGALPQWTREGKELTFAVGGGSRRLQLPRRRNGPASQFTRFWGGGQGLQSSRPGAGRHHARCRSEPSMGLGPRYGRASGIRRRRRGASGQGGGSRNGPARAPPS